MKRLFFMSALALLLVSCVREKAGFNGVTSKLITIDVSAPSVTTRSLGSGEDVLLDEIELEAATTQNQRIHTYSHKTIVRFRQNG